MRLKPLALSVLVLAALAAVAWYLRRPAPPLSADARIGQSLVASATVEKAATLRVHDQGKTVELVRQPDGTWRVASYFDLAADFSKLTGFIGNLTDSKVQRLVTTSAARIARLEFKDTGVTLLDAAGKELWSVTLGKTPETGGGRFVRFGTEEKAYLASFSAWLDVESKNWASPELLNLKPDTIARIEIPLADGEPVVLSRAKKETPWTADKAPANQKVNAGRITSLLASLGSLRFTDSNDPAEASVAAAKANLLTFKLTTFDHRTVTVALGRKPEEKKLKAPVAPENKAVPATESPKNEDPAKQADTTSGGAPKSAEIKPPAPEYDITPAGPVFVFISDSNAAAPVNALMSRRAFQVSDFIFTGLPRKPAEIFEAVPPAAAVPAPAVISAPAGKKPDEKKPPS